MSLLTIKDNILYADSIEDMFKKACDPSVPNAVVEPVSDQELEHLRAAFYAGAAAIFMLEEELADSNLPDEITFKVLDGAQADCSDFFALQALQLPTGGTVH